MVLYQLLFLLVAIVILAESKHKANVIVFFLFHEIYKVHLEILSKDHTFLKSTKLCL